VAHRKGSKPAQLNAVTTLERAANFIKDCGDKSLQVAMIQRWVLRR